MKRYPIVVFVALAVALFSVTVASGQAPPAPVTRYTTRFTAVAAPASSFEIVQQVVEFAPGAALPFHSHGGPAFVTVIEGELIFREFGKAGVPVKAGETIREEAGQVLDVSNASTARARASVAFLLPAGAALTTVQPGVIPPSLGARVLGLTRGQVTSPAASFDVVQLVFDFAPGSFGAVHKHGGPGQATVFEGEVTKREGSQVTAYPAGQGFPEVPDAVLSVGNTGATSASMAVVFLLPAGAVLTTPVNAPGPPATGTGTADQAGAWQSPGLLAVTLLGVTLLAGAAAVAARRSRR